MAGAESVNTASPSPAPGAAPIRSRPRLSLRRPSLWLAVPTAIVFAILVILGTWQLQRLAWKTEVIALRAERLALPPLKLAEALAYPIAAEYRKITVTGWYMHAQELIGPAASHRGKTGVSLVTPFAVDDGPVLLVDRGWIPLESRDAEARPQTRTHARVELTAYLRLPQEGGGFAPANRPQDWLWYRIVPLEMLGMLGIRGETRAYLQAAPAPDAPADTLPVAASPRVDLANPHLGYAITWFGLAATLVGVFAAFHLRKEPAPHAHAPRQPA